MPSRSTIAVAIACLGFGFAGGWTLHRPGPPSVAPAMATGPALAAVPSQEEAADAVRRHPAGISSLDHAGVTLGSCDPEGGLARCAIELVWDTRRPGTPQRRVVTFGRIAGRWEVTIW